LKKTLKSRLLTTIPQELHEFIPNSFDILGSKEKSIALIEIPKETSSYEKEIAEAVMFMHKNVESVLSKESKRYGEFRIRDLRLIIGNENTEIIHREAGCRLKCDPRKTYFSTRESTERERISNQVKKNEDILVMFSGIGSYPICIAKQHPNARITAVEINPDAHNYCVENIKLNQVSAQIFPLLGDVREVCPSLGKKYDRVIMPLPMGAFKYLDTSIPLIKKEGVLHFYHWAPNENLYDEAETLVRNAALELSKEIEVVNRIKVSKYNPKISKIRIDVKIF
jgi:tRNA (guanine37-N1)-methyltransferase